MSIAWIQSQQLDLWERELVSFVFERSWGKPWRGENIPKDIFRSFVAHARRISDNFTLDRRNFEAGYLRSKEGRSAYLLYFHLANVLRTAAVLDEIHRRGLWPAKPLRILDVGSGSAPSLWALALAAQRWKTELKEMVALDGEKSILPDAAELFSRFARTEKLSLPKLKTVRADFFDQRTEGTLSRLGKFDLIICSNVLNELSRLPVIKLNTIIRKFTSENLTDDGMLIVVEPALQVTSRQLASMRDEWLKNLPIHVSIPCSHQGPCPLNQEPRDWCHFEVDWKPPPIRNRLEKALEHASGSLKYSYLVFRKGEGAIQPNQYRVLSNTLTTPQGPLILLCSPERKLSLRIDSRSERFGRGDLVEAKLEATLKGVHRYAQPVALVRGTEVKKL